MFKNFAVVTVQSLVLLGLLLSIVTGEESLDINGIDYGNSDSSSSNSPIKRKCVDYADHLFCQYLNYLQERGKDDETDPNGGINEIEIPKEDGHQDVIIEIPVEAFDNNLEKRFKVFRRQNFFSQGYKRGPGFRSWGGKRDPNLQKRSKFGAWGGKRTQDSPDTWENDKRTRFTNWGGKRDDYEEPADKRSKFQSWGGKRAEQDIQYGDLEYPVPLDSAQKRDADWNYRNLYLREPFKKHFPKRPQFQSWGGKRTPSPWNNLLQYYYFQHYQPQKLNAGNAWMGEVKRKFSSWGGKRNGQDESPLGIWSGNDEDEPPASLQSINEKLREKRGNKNAEYTTYVKLADDSKASKEEKAKR